MAAIMLFTSNLIWKLEDVGAFLRDCSEDILVFAKTFCQQLVDSGEDQVTPQSFSRNWNLSLQKFAEATSSKRARTIDLKMIWFAEDLISKQFAQAVLLYRETEKPNIVPSSSHPADDPKLADHESESRSGDHAGFTKDGVRQPETEDRAQCHTFPPGKPVMVEESERNPMIHHRFAHLLPGGDHENAIFEEVLPEE